MKTLDKKNDVCKLYISKTKQKKTGTLLENLKKIQFSSSKDKDVASNVDKYLYWYEK